MLMILAAGCGAKPQAAPASQGAETSAASTKAAAGKYSVRVEDESGAPVADTSIQFCTDTFCISKKTDAEGIAVFEQSPGSGYFIHVLKVPEGYAEDETEYPVPEKHGTVNIVLRTAETEAGTGEEAAEEENAGEAEGEMFEGLKIGDQVFYESSDLEGDPLRSIALFSEAKVTMINLWATWCYYCVVELPDLAELAKEFEAQDCRIIGICTDANDPDSAEAARALLKDAGVEYVNLRGEDHVFEVFPARCLPTTFFVDREGKVLTDPVEGANLNAYREAMKEALKRVE